jgi:hypothetical protein
MNQKAQSITLVPHLRPAVLVAFGLLALLLPAHSADRSKKTPMIRIVCPSTLDAQAEYVLASKKKNGSWRKREELNLRPSYFSDWIEAPEGELAICVVEDRDLAAKWTFTFAKGVRRALVVLLPGEKDAPGTATVIDTDKQAFAKGETLVINSSKLSCSVKLGDEETICEHGEHHIIKASPDDKGMYQMLVTYTDEKGEVVTCNDRFLSINEAAREFLLLAPRSQSSGSGPQPLRLWPF